MGSTLVILTEKGEKNEINIFVSSESESLHCNDSSKESLFILHGNNLVRKSTPQEFCVSCILSVWLKKQELNQKTQWYLINAIHS